MIYFNRWTMKILSYVVLYFFLPHDNKDIILCLVTFQTKFLLTVGY